MTLAMKSPPPDLPDTDDPWTLLDVPRGSPSPEIRRAYLRRIKVYKPDRHPEAFRRIREAFDALYLDEREAPGGVSGWDEGEAPPPVDSIEHGWGRTAEPDAEPAEAPPAAAPRPSDRGRTSELVEALKAAITADDRDGAVHLLLQPENAPLANDIRVADAVVRVACSVVLSQPDRFEELSAAYHDVLLDRSLEHGDGILLQMRGAAPQWPAWQRATEGVPELSRFVELAGTLTGDPLQALGRELHERAEADPPAFLERLDRVGRDAPAVLELYLRAAEEWSERFGPPAPSGAESEATIVDGLQSLLLRNEVLSAAKLRRTILNALVIGAVLWVSPAHPILLGMAALALMTLVHALAFDPTARIYREILRPAIAAWAWQGHDLDRAVVALGALVARQPVSRRLLEPDAPTRYPELLAADAALAAYAATGRLRHGGQSPIETA